MSSPTVLSVIEQRRSHRSYSNQPIETEKIEAVLRAAMYAPSAHHRRAWEFVVVKEPDKIKQLGQMKQWSEHVAESQAVIAICSPDWDNWLEDASIVGAFIYLEATHQDLATCWTQVRGSTTWDGDDTEDYVRDVLSIPQDMRVLCLMPLGYPSQEKKPHQPTEFEQSKIHYEQW